MRKPSLFFRLLKGIFIIILMARLLKLFRYFRENLLQKFKSVNFPFSLKKSVLQCIVVEQYRHSTNSCYISSRHGRM